MKRIFVVDDEKPVVDLIVRIVQTELSSDFCVVDTASSGREALEKWASVQADIVLMDVKMPGISGLDTVRELKRRGSTAAFLLATAYERFDIAREALELQIAGYLLKPVARDKLAQALKAASEVHDRWAEWERRKLGGSERDEQVRSFVVCALTGQLMLGDSKSEPFRAMKRWLGIEAPWGIVVAAHVQRDAAETNRRFEDAVQYKTQAICGPSVGGRRAVLLPVADPAKAEDETTAFENALRNALADEIRRGAIEFASSDLLPAEDWAQGWASALQRLKRGPSSELERSFAPSRNFTYEEEFVSALAIGDPHGVRTALEALLEGLESVEEVSAVDRYRIISLLGFSWGRLVRLGVMDEREARASFDFDDLRNASDGREFCLLVRSRLPAITSAVSRARLWSPPVAAALEYMRQNYSQPMTLDTVADRLGMTPKRLSRLFIDEVGQGFSDHLIDIRIEKAKLLLALPGASIKQVSVECGYPDPNYFSRLFKKVTGVPPSAYSNAP